MKRYQQGLALAVTAALLAGAMAGAAWAAAAGRTWPMKKDGTTNIVDTPHFQIKTDFPPEVAQTMANQQEALFAEVVRRIGGGKLASQVQRSQILVFTSEAKSREALAKEPNVPPMFSKDRITGWFPPDGTDQLLSTIRREGTRQLVGQFIGPKCPVWVQIGLAKYFEYGQFKDGVFKFGQAPIVEVNDLKKGLAANKLIPLGDMLGMDVTQWNARAKANSPEAAYQLEQSWAMAHFLDSADNGKFRQPFAVFMGSIPQAASAMAAWTKVFGADVGAFEARWRQYLKDLKPTGGLPCRTNLFALAGVLLDVKPSSEMAGDIMKFRQAAIDGAFSRRTLEVGGVTLGWDEPELVKSFFHCPEDKSPIDTCSYEFGPTAKGAEVPALRCRHHAGIVLETSYEKDAKAKSTTININAVPAKDAPPAPKGDAKDDGKAPAKAPAGKPVKAPGKAAGAKAP